MPPLNPPTALDADLFAAAARAAGGRPSVERLAVEPIGPLLALSGARAGALHLRAARCPAPWLVPGAVVHDLRRGVRQGRPWVWQAREEGVAALVAVTAQGAPQGELWLVGGELMLTRLAATAELVVLACDLIGAAAALAAGRGAMDGCRGVDGPTGLVDRGDLLRRLASAIAAPPAGPGAVVVALACERAVDGRAARAFADRLAAALRATDVAAWLGGGIFGALLVGQGAEQARTCVERVRRDLEAHAGVAVAAGITCLEPGDRDPEDVLARAEAALADARWAGGGQVRALGRAPRIGLHAVVPPAGAAAMPVPPR